MDLNGKHYTWFQNRECEYFPCNKGVREEEFNCLFCYCPLYNIHFFCLCSRMYDKIKKCLFFHFCHICRNSNDIF